MPEPTTTNSYLRASMMSPRIDGGLTNCMERTPEGSAGEAHCDHRPREPHSSPAEHGLESFREVVDEPGVSAFEGVRWICSVRRLEAKPVSQVLAHGGVEQHRALGEIADASAEAAYVECLDIGAVIGDAALSGLPQPG